LLAAVGWAFTTQAWEVVRTLVENLNTYLDLRALWGDMVAGGQMAVAAARQEGNRAAEGMALNNLGVVYRAQGRWAEALAVYEPSLAIRRELGDRHGEGQTLNNLSGVYAAQGELDKAFSAYQQSLSILLELGDQPGVVLVSCRLGWILCRRGEMEADAGHFARALALSLVLHPRLVMDTLDRIIALAKESAATGNMAAVGQLGQKLLEVVEPSTEQQGRDEALQAATMLCQQVCTVLAQLERSVAAAPNERRQVQTQVLESAKKVDAFTQGRWALETWVQQLLANQDARDPEQGKVQPGFFAAVRRVAQRLMRGFM
jgi:tetratricopeptide (TPR) repeat protein